MRKVNGAYDNGHASNNDVERFDAPADEDKEWPAGLLNCLSRHYIQEWLERRYDKQLDLPHGWQHILSIQLQGRLMQRSKNSYSCHTCSDIDYSSGHYTIGPYNSTKSGYSCRLTCLCTWDTDGGTGSLH